MTTWWGLSVESHCWEYIFHISQVCLCPAYRGLSHRIISTYLCELPLAYCSTVYWEIFAVNFHGCQYPQRLHARNFFQQWSSVTVFLIQEVCCHPQNTLGNSYRQVEEAICTASSRKRGPYGQYILTVWAEIGKYAYHRGVTAPVAASQIWDFMINMAATNAPVSSILLHIFSALNFRGRPIARKFYCVKFFHANLL